MSSTTPAIDALAHNALSRKPRQGRSLASFERMLSASKELMLEIGSENFTLQDVSERGNVSIGSIYLRFESKDRLLHAVIAEELQTIIASEREMVDALLAKHNSLKAFLPAYIDNYSTFLEGRAAVLRTIMERAAMDPAVSEPGKETARRSAEMSVAALMTFSNEIASKNPEANCNAAFQIIFASIARQFGLGSTPESRGDASWSMIKVELAKMTLAYLQHAD